MSERTCGDCSACCAGTGMRIPEVEKTGYEPCRHLVFGRCSVYSERPEPCREFECQWKLGFGRLMERPDKVGFFLDSSDGGLGSVLVAREAWPGAFASRAVELRLDALKERCLVIRVRERERDLIGPEHLVAEIKKRGLAIEEL